ncbi:MAG: carbohydrate ABC transporter permease [Spirochaetales bacterium]|nr:carbohydrate ABC transporter permease [Spirochaetales bacterium]
MTPKNFTNIRQSKQQKSDPFPRINGILMILICFMTLYPVWYSVVISFNDGQDALLGGIYWWPRIFSIESYRAMFSHQGILQAFLISIFRTVAGTATHLLFTAMVAYAFLQTRLIGRKAYMTIGVITMFFNGGLIPTFLLVKNLGLIDNLLVYLFPSMFNFFHLIIFQAFFREIPKSLEESAMMDGMNDFGIFVRIILPLSAPVMATIALFQGVWHWNDFFIGIIYVNEMELQPVATYLYRVIAQNQSSQMMVNMPASISRNAVTSQSIKMATMVAATFPIVLVYPFLQKYFVKGLLVGSIKG